MSWVESCSGAVERRPNTLAVVDSGQEVVCRLWLEQPIRCAVATLIRKVVLGLSTIASICVAGEIFLPTVFCWGSAP